MGVLDKWGPVVLSVLKDDVSDEAKAGADIYKVIVRFKDVRLVLEKILSI